jgi:Fe-S cluster biosynthesis and repair protein YggX
MNLDLRIAQWENMTQADPENDMGWFSLGNAYRDAGRLADAERAYARCLSINAAMSRAYQLRGQCLLQLERRDEAAELLLKGYEKAASLGDVMPQRAMASLLQQLGRALPEVARSAVPPEVASGQAVIDRRTGRVGARMPGAPIRGVLGRFIAEHYSITTWREWLGMGTKVINELRLDFSNPEHQKVYDRHMMEWLGVSEEDLAQYTHLLGEAAKPVAPAPPRA